MQCTFVRCELRQTATLGSLEDATRSSKTATLAWEADTVREIPRCHLAWWGEICFQSFYNNIFIIQIVNTFVLIYFVVSMHTVLYSLYGFRSKVWSIKSNYVRYGVRLLPPEQFKIHTHRSVEAAEGRTAHYNCWNGANGIALNTLNTITLKWYFIPFNLFRSSHYHEPFLPNKGATNSLCHRYQISSETSFWS